MKKVVLFLLLIIVPFMTYSLPIGDVDGDGKVQVKDYILIRRHILKNPELKGDNLKRADVNSDGKITMKDYLEIRKILLGKSTLVPSVTCSNGFTKEDSKCYATITFNANGGTVTEKTRKKYDGETYGTLPTPTRNGYKFVGWFTSSSGNIDISYYKSSYSDLSKNLGNDEILYIRHWFQHGIGEGRRSSSIQVLSNDKITGNITLYAGWVGNCSAGYYLDTSTKACKSCPSGYYCPRGETYSLTDSLNAGKIICAAGTYSKEGAASCTACPAGYQSNAGASSCTIKATPTPTPKPTPTSTPKPTPVPTSTPVTVLPQIPIKIQSGFSKTREYNSSTFKFWIEHASFNGGSAGYKEYGSTNLFFTHVWVKDPTSQIKIALGGGTSLGNSKPKDLMQSEISRNGYATKGLVAVNSSFFGDSGITDWGRTQSTRVVIYNGKFLRDDCNKNFGSGKIIYSSYGITGNGEFKIYNTASTSTCATAKQAMINDGVKYSGSAYTMIKRDFVDNAAQGYSRTMVCTVDTNNFILLSVYNWKFDKAAEVAYDKLGCQSLLSVDGGGSTTLLLKYNDSKLDNAFLTDRKIADMLYFVEQ